MKFYVTQWFIRDGRPGSTPTKPHSVLLQVRDVGDLEKKAFELWDVQDPDMEGHFSKDPDGIADFCIVDKDNGEYILLLTEIEPSPHFAALQEIYDILYCDSDEDGKDFYDPEKDWSSDQLSNVGEVIGQFFELPPEIKGDDLEPNRERPPTIIR